MVIPDVKTSSMNNWDGEEVLFEIDRDDDSMKKIVGILTSDLYKNKPGAVVRELSTNCLDAHRINSSTEQFTIQLPTTYNNNFLVIRDYGPGLSKDDMVNLYTKYGKSTKDQVNDYTGCLGLGSKSPLSICSNFLVTSYHEDEVNTYSVYLNPDGQPALQMINSVKVHVEGEAIDASIVSKLLLKSDYDEYNWYKNFLIAKVSSDNKLIFGIKLRPYFNGISSDVNELTKETILSNLIELNIHLLDNNRKLFKTLFVFNDKLRTPDYAGGLELNERLEVISNKEILTNDLITTESSIVKIENIDYNDLDSVEQSRHNDGFSFFSVDLSELVPELGTNGYFIEAQQVYTDEENNKKESETNLRYQTILNYTYDLEFRTGLKIEIPIASQYRSQIIQEVNNQLLFFPIQPRVIEMTSTGPEQKANFNYSFIVNEKVGVEVAPGVHLLKNNHLPNYNARHTSYGISISTIEGMFNKKGGCLLVQGGVAYPVELDLIQNTIKSTSRDPRFKIDMTDFASFELYVKYLSDNMILFFDIGEISFNPSREGLNYDALTCIKIYDKIRQIMSQYKSDMVSFLEGAVDELELEQRYHSLKSTYNGLSLLSQFNNDNRYVTELAKTIKFVTLADGVEYDCTKPGFSKKVVELFKPIDEINDILKVKTKMPRPAFWEKNRNSNDLYYPKDYNEICKQAHFPYFVLVDGKKYRRVINDHLRSIINQKFSKHYEEGIVKVYEDGPLPKRVIDSKATAMYKLGFGEKLLPLQDDNYYYISKQIYIIFEEHLNLENKPEHQSVEEYVQEQLNLKTVPGSAGFFPRVLNYKKELKEMLESGKISTPTKTKTRAFTGLGYMYPFSLFNMDESKRTGGPHIQYKNLMTLINNIKNKTLMEKDEFNIENDEEMEEFISELKDGSSILIPFDNKSKTFVNPFPDKTDSYRMNILHYLMDEILSGEITDYLWFLQNIGIINNDTKVVFAKHSICEKQDLSQYSLFEETKFLDHIQKIIEFHKDKNYTRIDTDKVENIYFGGSYSSLDKVFDENRNKVRMITWDKFKEKPFTLNSYPESYNKKHKVLPASYVPGFAIDYFVMKEAFQKVIVNYQRTDKLISVFRKIDKTNNVGFFYRLYYNFHLIQEIDRLEEEYKLEKVAEPTLMNNSMRKKVYTFLETIKKPEFSISTISLNDLEKFKYKYPLYYEFIDAYANVTKTYINSDDINHYNYVLKKFMQYNDNAIQHMEGVFLNLFKIVKLDSKLNMDNLQEKVNDIFIYSYPRIYSKDVSRHSYKLLIRKHITGTKVFKKSVQHIKQTMHTNAMKEVMEIERKLFQDENIKQWFKHNQLKPAIGFNTPKELLLLCS